MANIQYFVFRDYAFNVTDGYNLTKDNIPSKLNQEFLEGIYEDVKKKVPIRQDWNKVDETKPILFAYDPDSDEIVLIDGHHRLRKYIDRLEEDPIKLIGHFLTLEQSKQILHKLSDIQHTFLPQEDKFIDGIPITPVKTISYIQPTRKYLYQSYPTTFLPYRSTAFFY